MAGRPPSDLPLALHDVSYRAGETIILDGVSLHLTTGAPTIIIGPNGSGKTTLLRVAMGLLQPTIGRVTWGGRENSPPIRRAFVFQRPVMLRRSAAANIHYVLKSAGVPRRRWTEETKRLLDMVGLPNLGARPARKLSGGEQQRLALARALARDPEILFLDEPTAALDPISTQSIEEILQSAAARNIKIVMSTHDLHEARRLAGDIVFMNRGRVIENAPSATFFTSPATEDGRRFTRGELLT
ncbi:ATPase component of tungstate ABC transporter [Afipia carboxidovorans OM5]|uniref:ABC transporter ATP-binding protein n=1 Tax=Afipia carboxidovorans (strain ATCC 49405 / DSM 1227 / KCTC 32145 / OM5) TaxID=504832 RepID=B6JGD6_AFIC5|nr:ATP-binding cassette domain-containing protein [Afipia carboxidovorans]ACI93818.1 ATPase component of tungstate ABC transporter [Afipia carboxidovorans OM5]AEI02502.1 ABC transporter ATP-binding protein [Afipia carboxidovorans OM4]AEI06078.1 ABC transporter ATP-binding protein [Afipia carboxidovorans OM5]BEV46870.1 ATP-binding cassette domain-containing protein [Afipia carboxidovorans]